MNTAVIILNDDTLRTSLKEVLRVYTKKADRAGMDAVLSLWKALAQDQYKNENGKVDTQVEVLLETKEGKTWLMTIPPIRENSIKVVENSAENKENSSVNSDPLDVNQP